MSWLRRAVSKGLETAIHNLRRALLATAVTVQYDSARESGRQLNVHLRNEPFTTRQQRQSRMGGGEEGDGKLRDYVPVEPSVL